ncbi:hypothetical protein FRC12_012717 [Ceratobasidium sp. 428]|nr:hypothetical protein FRC12_012717 [Ceratobasidium sp. 428]
MKTSPPEQLKSPAFAVPPPVPIFSPPLISTQLNLTSSSPTHPPALAPLLLFPTLTSAPAVKRRCPTIPTMLQSLWSTKLAQRLTKSAKASTAALSAQRLRRFGYPQRFCPEEH